MLNLNLAFRFFIPKHRRFIFYLAISSLMLGVAFLVVTLAVVSGFESSLRRSVIDVTGDVFITTRRARSETWQQMWKNIKPEIDSVLSTHSGAKTQSSAENPKGGNEEQATSQVKAIPFLFAQGIVASEGKLSGVVVQGVKESIDVLNLKSRLVSGEVNLKRGDDSLFPALIGRGLAEKLNLKVGDQFHIVFPLVDEYNPESFKRKLGVFELRGILDLGQYKYDERYILTDIKGMRNLLAVGKGYSGLMVSLPRHDLAREVSARINTEFPARYRSRDWFQANRNLFQAIVIEKRVIFMVVSIILIVAAFNLSSTLFINVVQKYREISVLKSLGLSGKSVIAVFLWQGVIIGLIGLAGGILLGFMFTELFQHVLENYLKIPGDVYKLNQLDLEVKLWDVTLISCFTLLVCLLSTLAPAINGSRISITNGLRYE